MANADDIREFLTTRRARLSPAQAGLPTYGRQRRVAGLRREEVALLAGISVEYYTRLERGNARGVSDDVLDAVAKALAARGWAVATMRLGWRAKNPIRLDDAQRAELDTFLTELDSDDDVQHIFVALTD